MLKFLDKAGLIIFKKKIENSITSKLSGFSKGISYKELTVPMDGTLTLNLTELEVNQYVIYKCKLTATPASTPSYSILNVSGLSDSSTIYLFQKFDTDRSEYAYVQDIPDNGILTKSTLITISNTMDPRIDTASGTCDYYFLIGRIK